MELNNCKVVIINSNDENNNLTDGKINYLGYRDSDESHGDIMIDYGIRTYGDNSIYEILNEGFYLPIYPAFFLAEYDCNVVFLNVSSKQTGKLGILYLPSDISDEQVAALNSLSCNLKDFDIEVNRKLKLNDGLVDSNCTFIKGDNLSSIVSKQHQKIKKA